MAAWEAVTTTWALFADEDEYVLEITCRLGRKRKMRRVGIGLRQASSWIETIRSSRVSLLPDAIPTCDGSHYELRAGDAATSVCLSWYNVPPEGAEALDQFVERLWGFVTPDLHFSEEEYL